VQSTSHIIGVNKQIFTDKGAKYQKFVLKLFCAPSHTQPYNDHSQSHQPSKTLE